MTIMAEVEDPFADPGATDDDMFADPEAGGSGWLNGNGRYRLPQRDGSHKPKGWTRCTNIVGVLADQYALRGWELRNLLCGVVVDPTIYPDAVRLVNRAERSTKGLKPFQDEVEALLGRAKEAAKGNVGSQHGTREHTMIERWHMDMVEPNDLNARDRLWLYRAAIEPVFRPLPQYVERRVMLESADMCGTLDNIMECRVSLNWHIVDTKTQRRFYTWIEVEAQLAGYAHADAMWEGSPDGGRWVDMPKVDLTRGAVAWVPRPERREDSTMEEPRAEVKSLDLERGWRNFQLAVRLYRERSACGSTRQAVSGLPWTPTARSVETWARLLASVESMAEGSRVVAEARAAGVWCPVLEDVAKSAAERLTVTKN